MKIEFISMIEPKPNDEILNKEEEMWNIKLPKAYREYLIDFNGASPKKRSFLCNNHEYAVDRFLCVLENTEDSEYGSYDIDVVLTQIEDKLTDNEDLVGCELLPIAQLFAGDYVCLDFRKKTNRPEVCVWSHEESGELDPITYKVSESFEEYLKLLY